MIDPSNQEEIFLAEIVASPLALEPRLVYADWLEERADARAAFVRGQLALRACAFGTEEFARHQEQLLEWSQSLPPDWLGRLGFFHAPQSTDPLHLQQMFEAHPLVVLRFHALWSGPCRQMARVIDEVAMNCAGMCVFLDANIDDQVQMAKNHRITAVPTILLFKHRKVVETQLGVVRASAILKMIEDHA